MNSRERVLKAVNFEKPDRVPIDLGGMRASGINAVVYDKLKKRAGIQTPTKIHDNMQILEAVVPEIAPRGRLEEFWNGHRSKDLKKYLQKQPEPPTHGFSVPWSAHNPPIYNDLQAFFSVKMRLTSE